MVDVAGVRFKNIGKIYYFDPGDFELKPGCGVIVETARGMEFGTVTMGRTAVNDGEIKKPQVLRSKERRVGKECSSR